MEYSFLDWMLFCAPVWFVVGTWAVVRWQLNIRPLFFRKSEIERLGAELLDAHGDVAEAYAVMEEDRAWRYSKASDQGRWRRVRKYLARRRRSGDT